MIFWVRFLNIPVVLLHRFVFKNVIFLVLLKKIKKFIIFVF